MKGLFPENTSTMDRFQGKKETGHFYSVRLDVLLCECDLEVSDMRTPELSTLTDYVIIE